MSPERPARPPTVESRTFAGLLIAVSLAFFWILTPLYGAVLWGAIIALLAVPYYRRALERLGGRRSLAALATLLATVVIVVIPMLLIAGALLEQSVAIYHSIQSGELNFGQYFQQIVAALPDWLIRLLDRFGLVNLEAVRARLTASAAQISGLVATRALSIGQLTLDFMVQFAVALYLSFFLLRDGAALAARIRDAIPLDAAHKRDLAAKFVTVVRATVKGNVVVAIVQGALGGVAFWFLGVGGALLWAALMAFLSLLPAVGAALVWLPVACYFLAIGAVAKGVGLIVYGVLVIGLVDNVLRPILVGKDTKMPDYVVLISTLGGLAIFGLNGFVLGPMVAAMFIAVWNLFVQERTAGDRPGEDARSPSQRFDASPWRRDPPASTL